MSDPDLVKWTPIAAALGKVSNPLRVPYQTGLKEAVVAAIFQTEYWEPADGRPGLVRVKGRLREETSVEVHSLVRAIQAAHTEYLLIVDPKVIKYGDEARKTVSSLEATIDFTLDDGIEEEADQQLQALKRFDAEVGESSLALAQSLNNYAKLADSLKARILEADSEFDVALIARAQELALLLSADPAKPPAPEPARNAKLLRDQLLCLLSERVTSIRSAAKYVFQDYPEIVRRVTSAYERRRRAELRVKKADEAKKAEDAKKAVETEKS